MSDLKITQLTAITGPNISPSADVGVLVDISDTSMAASGTDKKATLNDYLSAGSTVISDADTTATADTRTIIYSTLTATRTVTLPAANAVPRGWAITICDQSGNASWRTPIKVARAGSDLIDGSSSSVLIDGAYFYATFISDGTSKWDGGAIATKLYVDIVPEVPDRCVLSGHSWTSYDFAPAIANAWGSFDTSQMPWQRDRRYLPHALWSALGLPGPRFLQQKIPAQSAAGADISTLIGTVQELSLVEAISYSCAGGITGANTNFLEQEVQLPGIFGLSTFCDKRYTSGVNAPNANNAGYPTPLFGLFQVGVPASGDITLLPRDNANAIASVAYNTFLQCFELPPGAYLNFLQHQVGTGLADPGGIVTVRLGGRCRNVGVGGSKASESGIYTGGWATFFAYEFRTEPPGAEVSVSATAATSATSVTVSPLNYPLNSGDAILFNNGVVATLTASANVGATSITVSALASPGLPAGSLGFTNFNSGAIGQGMSPRGLYVFVDGLNEAGQSTMDSSAFRESMRAKIARALCTYYQFDTRQAKFQFVAGNGAAAAWADFTQPKGGQWCALGNQLNAKKFTGAVGGTPPTITIVTTSHFEGGAVDLFFYALGGSSGGGVATIKVDGANPPNGACTVDTTATSPTLNVKTGVTVTISGTTTFTATAGTFSIHDVGKIVTGTGIPAGTFISSYTSSTVVTVNQACTNASGIAITMKGFVVMVKRLTGLSAGVHTILITLTSMAATDGSAMFIFAGDGWEARNPTTPVLVCNVAKVPTSFIGGTQDTNCDTLNNTELPNLLAGTSSVVGSNSTEPALPASVVLVDIQTAINKGSEFFIADGIHPNAKGVAVVVNEIMHAYNANFSVKQTVSH